MRPFTRRAAPAPDAVLAAAALPRGETVLASGRAGDGTWLLGTRRRLVLVALGVEGVEAAVTSLLLAFAIQAHKRFGTLDPQELASLKG